jgi:hypothetical protein
MVAGPRLVGERPRPGLLRVRGRPLDVWDTRANKVVYHESHDEAGNAPGTPAHQQAGSQ